MILFKIGYNNWDDGEHSIDKDKFCTLCMISFILFYSLHNVRHETLHDKTLGKAVVSALMLMLLPKQTELMYYLHMYL